MVEAINILMAVDNISVSAILSIELDSHRSVVDWVFSRQFSLEDQTLWFASCSHGGIVEILLLTFILIFEGKWSLSGFLIIWFHRSLYFMIAKWLRTETQLCAFLDEHLCFSDIFKSKKVVCNIFGCCVLMLHYQSQNI